MSAPGPPGGSGVPRNRERGRQSYYKYRRRHGPVIQSHTGGIPVKKYVRVTFYSVYISAVVVARSAFSSCVRLLFIVSGSRSSVQLERYRFCAADMPGNNDETEPTRHGNPCANFDVAVYADDDGASTAGVADRSNSIADFENGHSSWTYDWYSGSSGSSSGVSSSMSSSDSDSGGGSADDDGGNSSGGGSGGSVAGDDDVDTAGKGKKKKNSAAAVANGNNNNNNNNGGYKWIKSLCTILVQDGGERKQEREKRPAKPVKTILRPPTTYQYVIGMSGLPSKVPVYPRWT